VVASTRVKVQEGQGVLSYRYRGGGDEWKDISYPVRLEALPTPGGGRQVYFRCPAVGCGRRVSALYGGAVFACRRCHKLAYPSQREDRFERAGRKAEKIRAKLGWGGGLLCGDGCKPKGMHWRTYLRLVEHCDQLSNLSLLGLMQRLNLAQNMIDRLQEELPEETRGLFRKRG
jgi:hypothetical protein